MIRLPTLSSVVAQQNTKGREWSLSPGVSSRKNELGVCELELRHRTGPTVRLGAGRTAFRNKRVIVGTPRVWAWVCQVLRRFKEPAAVFAPMLQALRKCRCQPVTFQAIPSSNSRLAYVAKTRYRSSASTASCLCLLLSERICENMQFTPYVREG